jgi:hypothetical protein
VCAAVHKDLFNAGICEELEGIFDERGVREGQQALAAVSNALRTRACILTRGRSSVNGLKRVSKGSASIWKVSKQSATGGCRQLLPPPAAGSRAPPRQLWLCQPAGPSCLWAACCAVRGARWWGGCCEFGGMYRVAKSGDDSGTPTESCASRIQGIPENGLRFRWGLRAGRRGLAWVTVAVVLPGFHVWRWRSRTRGLVDPGRPS